MPNITINTTSRSFGLLPADLSQYANWINQYAPGLTIYQSQNNLMSNILSEGSAFVAYLINYGYSSFGLIAPNDLRVIAGPYTVDYIGSFSTSHSVVTSVRASDSANGHSLSQTGNFIYAGYPLLVAGQAGSTMAGFTYAIPNPAVPGSNLVDIMSLNVNWNGSYWSGTTPGYSGTISDTTDNKTITTTITENPTPISFIDTTPSTTGFLTLSTPDVVGIAINIRDSSTGVTADSAVISGFSFAANSVSVAHAVSAAFTGNDVVSISGLGILNPIGMLANTTSVTSVTLNDSAANVLTNLDLLETIAAQGRLTSITLTDPGKPVLIITSNQQTADALALQAIVSPHTISSPPSPGLLGSLSVNQQLELIYVAYFNRAADPGGFGFWGGQNVLSQNAGQSTAIALTNIANSFTPQPETIALYPFLGTSSLNLNTPEAQLGLTTFINSLYGNLFGHTPDVAGWAYWVGQLASGAVGLGAAALAIANGATGTDAITLQNKLAVALDFTTRTSTAGLGQAAPLPNSFLIAAKSVLSGVDGISLSDASVTFGMNATTTYISGSTTSKTGILGTNTDSLAPGSGNDPITITTSYSTIDPRHRQLHDPVPARYQRQFARAACGRYGPGGWLRPQHRCPGFALSVRRGEH